MARLKQRVGDAGLRLYLLAEAKDFREQYGHYSPDYWVVLSKAVDQLSAGQPYMLRRYELPRDHPAAPPVGGDPCDCLMLGADDVLTVGDGCGID